jgi:hypothetical protein
MIRLEAEHAAAYAAVCHAQTEADEAMPQCCLVRLLPYSGKEEDMGRMVILRRTPGGMLVVRHVGRPACYEYKFKWAEYSRKFQQVDRSRCELRDVPTEYQPTSKGS